LLRSIVFICLNLLVEVTLHPGQS